MGAQDAAWIVGVHDRDDERNPPAIVCQVGKTTLLYDARVIDDLHAMGSAIIGA